MASYARMRVSWVVSPNSDYSDAQSYVAADTDTPDEFSQLTVDAEVAGTTVGLGTFTTVCKLLVQNTDPTNYVVVGYTSLLGSAAQEIAVGAGRWIAIEDVDPTVDLLITAAPATADCSCVVVIWGS